MDRRKDTAVQAVPERLIGTGPTGIASVSARAFDLAMRIDREREPFDPQSLERPPLGPGRHAGGRRDVHQGRLDARG